MTLMQLLLLRLFYCVYFKYDFHCYGIFCTMHSMLAGMLIQGKPHKEKPRQPQEAMRGEKFRTMLPCLA